MKLRLQFINEGYMGCFCYSNFVPLKQDSILKLKYDK